MFYPTRHIFLPKPAFKHLGHFLLFLFIVSCAHSNANTIRQKLDSLLQLVKKDKQDTNKILHLSYIGENCYKLGDSKMLLQNADTLEALSRKLNYPKGIATAYIDHGNAYLQSGDNTKALDYYHRALDVYKSITDKKGIVTVMNNLGAIYGQESNFSKAFEYFSDALQTAKETGNKEGESISTNDIGIIYAEQGDYPKALEYFLRGLELDREMGDKLNTARAAGNIGIIYADEGDLKKALEYYIEAEKLNEELGDKHSIALNKSNIGLTYFHMDSLKKAAGFLQQALDIGIEINDKYTQMNALSNIGNIYRFINSVEDTSYMIYYFRALKIARENQYNMVEGQVLASMGESYAYQKNYKKALPIFTQSLKMALDLGDMKSTQIIYKDLSNAYLKTGDWENAYKMSLKSSTTEDSIFSSEKDREMGRLEAKGDFDKQQALQKADEDKKTALELAESKKQKLFILFVGVIALAIVLIAIAILRTLRTTREQKKVIEVQKMFVEQQTLLVEEKTKEIVDSITYAKRLQDAILPPLTEIKSQLPESFVLYKPKDIVAGDFYWMETASLNPSEGGTKEGKEIPPLGGRGAVFIAAADCTGHGVPGAMVSVVCSNALNRAVKEFGITDTGKILDKIRELVMETFEKSEKEVKDGMDISLACINTTTGKLQWSGANISLWYIISDALVEVAPDRQSVGKQVGGTAFSSHEIQLQKGNTFYLFTDGIAQQTGGAKGDKFSFEQLRIILQSLSKSGMEQQKKELEETFLNWKGAKEQDDDVLVIGVRV
jgi:tetratricopeptide (TPR) repeat protein/serine phosphatase RsbU (regulator of sigma subunit)